MFTAIRQMTQASGSMHTTDKFPMCTCAAVSQQGKVAMWLFVISQIFKLMCHCCGFQAVYTALKETETRATDLLPLWKLDFLAPLVPRQRKALEAVELIRATTERLIAQCKEMVDAEEQVPHLQTPSVPGTFQCA